MLLKNFKISNIRFMDKESCYGDGCTNVVEEQAIHQDYFFQKITAIDSINKEYIHCIISPVFDKNSTKLSTLFPIAVIMFDKKNHKVFYNYFWSRKLYTIMDPIKIGHILQRCPKYNSSYVIEFNVQTPDGKIIRAKRIMHLSKHGIIDKIIQLNINNEQQKRGESYNFIVFCSGTKQIIGVDQDEWFVSVDGEKKSFSSLYTALGEVIKSKML